MPKPKYPLATVGALIVATDDSLLLIKTHKWHHKWAVPGGKIDYGETIKTALKREFKEETNLDIYDIHWAATQESIESNEFYKKAHFIFLNFIAKSDSKEVILNNEAQEYAWVNKKEILEYDLNTPTRTLVEFYLKYGFSWGKL